jgi:NADPH2:quinone reductase
MRAVSITGFGESTVLAEVEAPEPEPGPGQVAIDVAYAAVGLVDVLFRRGDLADVPGAPKFRPPFIPGLEVSGTVRALGPGVTDIRVGQRVATLSRIGLGGYAAVAVADAALTIPLEIDDDLAHVVAVLPNTTTALLALTKATTLRADESVLVHGATGGLAAVFPAVARALGAAELIGTVGNNHRRATALSFGYDTVLTYDEFPAGLNGQQIDLVVDPVGGPIRTASLDVLAPLGRLLAVGHASSAADSSLSADNLWLTNHAVVGFNVGGYFAEDPSRARPAAVRALALLARSNLQVPVEVLPLGQAREAHRRLESRAVDGRLVLNVAG